MPDETRTFESDAELARTLKVSLVSKNGKPKGKQHKPASLKAQMPPTREIILRLIELIKNV